MTAVKKNWLLPNHGVIRKVGHAGRGISEVVSNSLQKCS